jgi:hypothetical protein
MDLISQINRPWSTLPNEHTQLEWCRRWTQSHKQTNERVGQIHSKLQCKHRTSFSIHLRWSGDQRNSFQKLMTLFGFLNSIVLLILSLCSTFRNGSHIGWSTGTSYRSETNLKLKKFWKIVRRVNCFQTSGKWYICDYLSGLWLIIWATIKHGRHRYQKWNSWPQKMKFSIDHWYKVESSYHNEPQKILTLFSHYTQCKSTFNVDGRFKCLCESE